MSESGSEKLPVIGISCGDLNGIGMEVIMKTFTDTEMMGFCTPVVFASGKVASYHRKAVGLDKFNFQVINDIEKIVPGKPNLLNCWQEDVVLELGRESKTVGAYAARSLDFACTMLEQDKIEALVTAPINKFTIYGENFPFSGHTDYLESRFKGKATMMMVSDEMKMALATVHIPLERVVENVSRDLLIGRLKSVHRTLLTDFGKNKGKIAVLSINPHAGDKGLIGEQDDQLVSPVIDEMFNEGIMAFGPYAADSFFGSGNYRNFDAILAMYHDQGLIPFKALSFGNGVNYSSGLDIIRTSPDHGTGFDIAGKGVANESSFRQAVLLACDLYRNRKQHKDISANPLRINRGKKEV